jgi:hypothetical protein
MTHMNRIKKHLPAVATSIVAAVAFALPSAPRAQDEEELTWYAVEIIVFERASEIGRNAEAWPTEPGLPELADALELSVEGMAPEELEAGRQKENQGENQTETQDDTQAETIPETEDRASPPGLLPRAFQLVPPEELRLTDAWKSLEKSSAYRPLLHLGWIQPGFPAEEARLVHVRNDNAALGAISTITDANSAPNAGATGASAAEETVPTFDSGAGDAPTLSSRIDLARDPSQVALDGTLRVHRARYLHVQADLLYYRPLDDDGNTPVPTEDDPTTIPAPDSPDTAFIEQLLAEEDVAPRLFRLTESRRMRSRELHYLDHPLFGVLVEAWPVELPELPVEAPLPPEGDAAPDEGGAAQPAPLLPAPTSSGSGG